jgi:outer membrane protein OmpA-like peptidoglycan-associated protein
MLMSACWQKHFRQFFLVALSAAMLSIIFYPLPVFAEEPSIEEMIGALSKKDTPPAAGTIRLRGVGGKKSSAPAGQLQLSIQFELGSANISTASRGLLTKLGTAMNSPALTGQRFRIEGHTDATGDAFINQRLSERRAQSVQNFLAQSSGVSSSRLISVGKGSSEPVDPVNPNAAVNRRVVIAVIDGIAPAQPSAAAAAPVSPSDETIAPGSGAKAAVAGAPAGTVKQVRGEVSVTRARESIKLTEGDSVREGDTVLTSAGASVLVQFSDDAKLLVRPGSTVRLTEFVDSGPIEGRSQAVELVFGALRYVTGTLGKLRPQGVRLKTPIATVGIRGTDIDIVHTIVTRGPHSAGTYVRVNSGEVELNGGDGSLVTLSTNEQAVAAPQGPRLRSGKRATAVKKLDAPTNLFTSGELDSIIDGK